MRDPEDLAVPAHQEHLPLQPRQEHLRLQLHRLHRLDLPDHELQCRPVGPEVLEGRRRRRE